MGPAGGLWGQLSNIFFFFAAIFGDILLIRISLVGGFVFLIINACTGLPNYKQVYLNQIDGEQLIFVDMIVWFVITGAFHLIVVYLHVRDEFPVKLQDEEEEAVWRLFYRRSGMPRLEFAEVMKRAHWRRCTAGEIIVDDSNALAYLHLIVEGVVEFDTVYHGVKSSPRQLYSGDLFDMRVTNVFGVRVGFNSESFRAVAKTDCTLLVWPFEAVNVMANRIAPAVSSYWRNMLLYSVASELNRSHQGVQELGTLDSRGIPEAPYWKEGSRSRDFDPLLPEERPEKNSLLGVLRWILASVKPFPPPGFRHNSLPKTGVLAKNRTEAVFDSLQQAKKEPSALGRGAAVSFLRHQNYFDRKSREPTPLARPSFGLETIGEVLEADTRPATGHSSMASTRLGVPTAGPVVGRLDGKQHSNTKPFAQSWHYV